MKILARNYWKIDPVFVFPEDEEIENLKKGSAALLIGDKSFIYEQKFDHVFDLAQEWIQYTSLPFVFACWISNKELPEGFKLKFSEALKYGINNIQSLLDANYKNIKSIPSPDKYLF